MQSYTLSKMPSAKRLQSILAMRMWSGPYKNKDYLEIFLYQGQKHILVHKYILMSRILISRFDCIHNTPTIMEQK